VLLLAHYFTEESINDSPERSHIEREAQSAGAEAAPEQQQSTRRRRVTQFQTHCSKGVHSLNVTVFRFDNEKRKQELRELDATADGYVSETELCGQQDLPGAAY
jgi:hypothetical protein